VRLQRLAFRAMGSPCELRLYGGTEAEAILEAAREEALRLEAKYSRYRDDSLATRINRSAGDRAGVEVDAETARLLDYADQCHRQSGGRFDVSSGILRRAWNLRAAKVPTQAEIDALLPRVGWHKIRWRTPHIVLPEPGMEIDFGGYVKEYAADRVAELCRARGVRHGLVDLGGDLAVIGPHPDGRPWRVGVRDPRNPRRALGTLPVGWGAVATSGDYERCMVVNGVRYGHILDPRTGWPVRGLASATVVASHCLVAGTLTTMALLMGADGADWLDGTGAPCLHVSESGEIGGSLTARKESDPVRYLSRELAGGGPCGGSATTSGFQPSATSGAAAALASESVAKPPT
jgi:thiamine biosynthesis lipoprotein